MKVSCFQEFQQTIIIKKWASETTQVGNYIVSIPSMHSIMVWQRGLWIELLVIEITALTINP